MNKADQAALCRTAILISGSGTNLQAFLDRVSDGRLALEIAIVVSNNADAAGLERAEMAGVPTACIAHGEFETREAFDQAVANTLDAYDPQLIILAGFMRILSPWFVRHYSGRVLNIHPALLPKYPGLDTHARVLAEGDTHHGSTVHFVTQTLDGGPPIVAGRLRVDPRESAHELAARVRTIEHQIYPTAAEWFASGRLVFRADDAWLDEKPLRTPVLIDFDG